MSSFSDKAKQVIATVAPILGTALGGPLGAAAGGLLAAALGTKLGDTSAAETALLTASPDTLAKLKQAELDFKAKMADLGVQEDQLQYADVASARQMQVATKDTTPRNLAYLVLGGTCLVIGAVLMGYAKVDSALAGTVIGYLISECKSVLGFYFGSSAGSAAKDATLAELAKE